MPPKINLQLIPNAIFSKKGKTLILNDPIVVLLDFTFLGDIKIDKKAIQTRTLGKDVPKAMKIPS